MRTPARLLQTLIFHLGLGGKIFEYLCPLPRVLFPGIVPGPGLEEFLGQLVLLSLRLLPVAEIGLPEVDQRLFPEP